MTGNENEIIEMGGNGMPKVIPAHLYLGDRSNCSTFGLAINPDPGSQLVF